ncbi:MAG: alpha/beta hydrolase [Magnetovibrio sp.]|nr:alpha/beta hydrolase [Magnetovibrio sp.]
MRFVYVHGWGFDARFWRSLQDCLGDGECLDLGFVSDPQLDISATDEPLVAVGHSFGVQWLLHHHANKPWQAFVSINGFARFVKAEGYDVGTHPRILKRMIQGFEQRPDGVYVDFMKLCGAADPNPQGLNYDPLRDGLEALYEWDEREALDLLAAPVLALAGGADQVVPQNMSEAAFVGHNLVIKADGDHVLPQSDPDWCAQQIQAFLEQNGQ